MKAIIFEDVIKKISSAKESDIYGFKNNETIFICSHDEKSSLKKIGVYSNKPKENEEGLWLTIKDGKPECFIGSENIPCEVINYKTDFQKRNHGIIDPSVLQERTVTIIGLGSGGSAIALDLARAGVEKFILIEHDTVELSNICRSAYDLADIGKKKTDALLEKMLRINPFLKVDVYSNNLFDIEKNTLQKIIDESDLIIDATDSVKTKQLINGIAYHEKPVIYPAVYSEGIGGDILFTIPGLTPCYECVFSQIIPQMQELRRSEWDYATGTTKPMSSLISDIQVVVARTVKLALAILTADQPNSFIEKITEQDCSILFISNQKGTFFEDDTFSEFWGKTEINPHCSCQTLK